MQRKIFLNFMIVLITGIFISSFLSIKIMQNQNYKNLENRIISDAYLVREIMTDKANYLSKEDLSSELKNIKNILNARITIIDISGKVLGDSDAKIENADNHHNRPEVLEALSGNVGIEKRYSDTVKEELLYCAVPFYINSKITGVIRLSSRLTDINLYMRSIYVNTFIALIFGIAIAAFMGYRMSISISKPIKEMTYMSAKISKGEFEKRIYVQSKDEIGELASSINNMASKLDETIYSLKDENSKMEAIMASVINGIIAIDNDERILFINPAAVNTLNIKASEIIGKHFLQIVRNNDIDDYIRKVIRERKFESTEINISYPQEKSLRVYTNPIKYVDSNDVMGLIIILQDTTEIKKLERMRTEFVANVSHELKTPLTSIKGFAETLRSGAMEDKETAEHFLGIIEEEADRLFRLINDILILSELENKKIKKYRDTIDFEYLINNVISIMANQAQSKNIKLTSDINLNVRNFLGDSDELKQMLINLVDNAIKYTPEYGMVLLEAYNDQENIVLIVADNGIGISKEYIPRLFERFYRVDKARSKRIGGTGLGLAIVKHIVKTYDGEIIVNSKEGKGTKFIVTLPIKA